MKLSWQSESAQLLLIGAMFVVAAASWSHLPDRVPVHWNLRGEVDGYGSKFIGLLLLPLVTLGVYALLIVLPRFDPGYVNYPSFAGTYNLIRVAMVVFLAVVYAVTVLAAFEQPIDVGLVVPLGVGALMLVLGNVMGKIRPNWFVGVRTPWTLSSKLSWTKTHRLAGWVFTVLGPLIALTGILRSDRLLWATLVFGGGAIAWMFVYSYLVYRTDPNRVPPTGTSPG